MPGHARSTAGIENPNSKDIPEEPEELPVQEPEPDPVQEPEQKLRYRSRSPHHNEKKELAAIFAEVGATSSDSAPLSKPATPLPPAPPAEDCLDALIEVQKK